MESIAKKNLWQNHIDKWNTSGLSQVEYCTIHKIPLSTFGYWKRKLEKDKSSQPVFYPLALSSMRDSNCREKNESNLTLHLKEGRFTIEIKKGFSSATLSKAVTTLEQL